MSELDDKNLEIVAEAPGHELPEEVDAKPDFVDPNGVRKSSFDELPILRTVKIFRWSVFYCFMCYTMSMLDGWGGGAALSIVVNKGFIKQFGTEQGAGVLALDPIWLSVWGAMTSIGQFTSIVTMPYLADRFGRKFCFLLSWVSFVLGLICLTVARTTAVWTVGNLFSGLSIGMEQLTVTPYAVEIAPTRVRGSLVTFQAVWASATQIIFNLMLEVMNEKYPLNWLKPFYVVWGMAALMLFSILILPESPWHLARRGKRDATIKSLRRLYGTVPGYDVEEEYNIILRTLAHEKVVLEATKAASYRYLFTGDNLRRTLIVMAFEAGNLLAGMAMVSNYGTYFLAIAGLSNPFLGNLIISIVNLAIIAVYCVLADKIGRRIPTLASFVVQCLTLWAMGGLYYAPSGKTSGIVLVLLACLWNGGSSITQNIYWLMAAEIPSAELRMKTCSAGLFWGAALGMSTNFAVPKMLVKMNLRAGFVWGAACIPTTIYCWLYLPETKGRSSAEIDELYERRVSPRKWRKTTTAVEEQMRQETAEYELDRGVGA